MTDESTIKQSRLRVTVDKSHIITIGERLYTESIELLRELVNNAYDADAQNVWVKLSESNIVVEDDGNGMDLEGLGQYFNIGSNEKVAHNISPMFKRNRVGQFGIGKFASLAAARTFEVRTQKGGFAAFVIFDKKVWQNSNEAWDLPLTILAPAPAGHDGTLITLSDMSRIFDVQEVERVLKDGVPLKAPHFKVFLNDKRVMPKTYSGKRFPVVDGCVFGPIHGELFILAESATNSEPAGIEVKVKQVTVKRETFGLDEWGHAGTRITGEINADFLPVTSDRTGFVSDSDEYRAFLNVVYGILVELKKSLGLMERRREHIKSSRALGEAITRLQTALSKNPQFSPFGVVDDPLSEESNPSTEGSGPAVAPMNPDHTEAKVRKRRAVYPKVKSLTPGAVIRKSRMGDSRVSFCLDHFGDTAQEAFTDGGVIYINVDHPLFVREVVKPGTFVMHLARLLTQEVALMNCPRNPRQAFERQSILLRDAFAK